MDRAAANFLRASSFPDDGPRLADDSEPLANPAVDDGECPVSDASAPAAASVAVVSQSPAVRTVDSEPADANDAALRRMFDIVLHTQWPQVIVRGLVPNAEYDVYVRGHNLLGPGPWSSAVRCKTQCTVGCFFFAFIVCDKSIGPQRPRVRSLTHRHMRLSAMMRCVCWLYTENRRWQCQGSEPRDSPVASLPPLDLCPRYTHRTPHSRSPPPPRCCVLPTGSGSICATSVVRYASS